MSSPIPNATNQTVTPPPVVDEDVLLEYLVSVLQSCGSARFFSCPILTPTKEFFPDPWLPNQIGLKIVAKRLMDYAGLGDLAVEVEIFTDQEALKARLAAKGQTHHGAAAWFLGIENNTAFFACESFNLSKPAALIATMGHEVAHAYRFYHGVVVPDRRREEELTDITSLYLGFGLFSCNASRTYEKSGTQRGFSTVTHETTNRLGYLSPRAFAFLLACQLVARGRKKEIRHIRNFLAPAHRQYFGEAMRDLKRNRPLLLNELGVTETEADRLSASAPTASFIPPAIIKDADQYAFHSTAKARIPTCPHCGQEIDYKIEKCPHCEATLPKRLPWPTAIIVAVIGIAIALWLSWP